MNINKIPFIMKKVIIFFLNICVLNVNKQNQSWSILSARWTALRASAKTSYQIFV